MFPTYADYLFCERARLRIWLLDWFRCYQKKTSVLVWFLLNCTKNSLLPEQQHFVPLCFI